MPPLPIPAGSSGVPRRARRPRRHRLSLGQRVGQAQRFESVAALAGGVVHELNNVFAPIIISAELLRRKYPEPEAQECLNLVLESARQGSAALRDVLTIAGGMDGEFEELHLPKALAKWAGILRDKLPACITLDVEAGPDLWPVHADISQVQRAITNLALNGAKAMPDGGRLFIHADNAMVREEMVSGHRGAKAGPHTRITVSDTGRAIPAAEIDRIFDPFKAAESAEHLPGMGLSVVYAIVQGHGGFIAVHSEPACGTEFEVYLPALAADAVKP